MSTAQDTLARTLWGEARSEGSEGMQAVANVVLNRVANPGWWGYDIESVCRKPYQFSSWNSTDPNLPKLLAVTPADPQFAQALQIAGLAVAGQLPDVTNGADSFKVTTLAWPASWGPQVAASAVIGAHSFYRLYPSTQPAGPKPQQLAVPVPLAPAQPTIPVAALPDAPKPWYTSKTLIGIAVMVLPQVVDAVSAHFNLSTADQQALLTTLTDIGSGIGTLLAIYGRVVATAPIKGKTS